MDAARFDGATFTGEAPFGATFTKAPRFDEAGARLTPEGTSLAHYWPTKMGTVLPPAAASSIIARRIRAEVRTLPRMNITRYGEPCPLCNDPLLLAVLQGHSAQSDFPIAERITGRRCSGCQADRPEWLEVMWEHYGDS